MEVSVVSEDDGRPSRLDSRPVFYSFFLNDTATTEIYTLSLHDALPIFGHEFLGAAAGHRARRAVVDAVAEFVAYRSEEHTSELQSHVNLVCRLLLEKKNDKSCTVMHVMGLSQALA